jgi:hypothetical protein
MGGCRRQEMIAPDGLIATPLAERGRPEALFRTALELPCGVGDHGPANTLVFMISRLRGQQLLQSLEPVRLDGGLVPADAGDAGKPHGHAGLVPGGPIESLEQDFEN